jgi:threonine dehydratase
VELKAEEMGSLADAIMVTRVGDAAFSIIQRLVDEIVMVNEDQIASAVLMLLERKRILAEGAGAVPLAALLQYAKGTLSSNKNSSIEEMLVIKQCTECILLADAAIRVYFTTTVHLIPCFRDYIRHFIDHLIADVGKV